MENSLLDVRISFCSTVSYRITKSQSDVDVRCKTLDLAWYNLHCNTMCSVFQLNSRIPFELGGH